MDEDMGCAGREGKNNGRNKMICGGLQMDNITLPMNITAHNLSCK